MFNILNQYNQYIRNLRFRFEFKCDRTFRIKQLDDHFHNASKASSDEPGRTNVRPRRSQAFKTLLECNEKQ